MADAEIANGEIDDLLPDEGVEQITPGGIATAIKKSTAFTKVATDALDTRITSEAGRASQAETALGGRIDDVATIAGNKITSQQAGTQFDLGLDVALADGGKIRNVFDGLTAADIAYGDGTVESTLNAEPTLHDDAVSTETYTAGLALKQNVADVRSEGAVRALAEAQITAEILPNGKIADAVKSAVDAIVLPTPRTNEEIDGRADARIAASPTVAANTAKIGTTPTERSRIAQIPGLASSVSNNNAKPTTTQVDAQADARIVEQTQEGGTIANYVRDNAGSGGGTEGALVLEDLALGTTERLCGVSGADTQPSGIHSANLTLECDSPTPTEGVASLGGVISFTTNSAFNGEFRIVNNAGSAIGIGNATRIGSGNSPQEWRIDGVEWDFTDTFSRTLSLASNTFTPEVSDLTFEFNGEITRGDLAGQAVAPVEAIVKKQIQPELIYEDTATHPDVYAPSLTGSYEGVVGSPTHESTFITITDEHANPLYKQAVTFEYSAIAVGAVGGSEPLITFQIIQRGEVIENYRLGDPSDLILVAVELFLNEPFEVRTSILWNTDVVLAKYRIGIKDIIATDKGVLFDAIQASIRNATEANFTRLSTEIDKIKTLTDGFGTTLQGIAEGQSRNSEILNRAAMTILAMATVEDTNVATDEATEANTTLGDGGKEFFIRFNAEKNYIAGTRKFAGIITNDNPEFTYGGERLVWAENGRLKTKLRHNAVQEVRRDRTHYPTDNAGDDAVADIVRPLSSSGAVQLDTDLPPVNTVVTIYAVVEDTNGRRYETASITGNWLSGFSQTVDVPEPSSGSVSLTARNNAGVLALEYTVSGHNPVIDASMLHLRAVWVEPGGTIVTQAADAFFEDRDIGAFNGQAVFGVDLDLADGGNFSNVGIVASNFTLDTNWYPNAIEASPETAIDGRGSILTDNAGMTLFRSRRVDAYTGENFATIQGYGDAGELDMGMFGAVEHHLKKVGVNAQMEVLDDKGGLYNIGNILKELMSETEPMEATRGSQRLRRTIVVEHEFDGTLNVSLSELPRRCELISTAILVTSTLNASAEVGILGDGHAVQADSNVPLSAAMGSTAVVYSSAFIDRDDPLLNISSGGSALTSGSLLIVCHYEITTPPTG